MQRSQNQNDLTYWENPKKITESVKQLFSKSTLPPKHIITTNYNKYKNLNPETQKSQ